MHCYKLKNVPNVYVWMCPICIFVSVETFLSLNMCQYDQSYNSLKCNQKFPEIKIWNSIAQCPPLKSHLKFSPYNVWKWFNGDRFKLIGVKLQEGFSLDLREHSIFRKMAKVSENSGKFIENKNSLRSVFIAAWPELVQFNCGNFLVCLFCFTNNQTNQQQKNTALVCLFVCFWKIKRQTLVSRLKYWLWLAVAALGYSMEMGDIFFSKIEVGLYSGICSWIKYLFLLRTQIKVIVNSNSWFCWVF